MDKDKLKENFIKWAQVNSIHPVTTKFFKDNIDHISKNLPLVIVAAISKLQYTYDKDIKAIKEILHMALDQVSGFEGLADQYIEYLTNIEEEIKETAKDMVNENEQLARLAKLQNDVLRSTSAEDVHESRKSSLAEHNEKKPFENSIKARPIKEEEINNMLIDLNTCEDVNDFINRM